MASDGTYPARIYRPAHKRQRLRLADGTLYGCTDTVTAMFADAVTFGAIDVTESWVRRHSTEPTPDPDSPGLNIPQAREVLRADLHLTSFDGSGLRWPRLWELIGENRRMLAQVWYDELPGISARIGHAILLQARRQRAGAPSGWEFLVNDPMRSDAVWIADDYIRGAMEEWGRRTGMSGGALRFAYSEALLYVAAGAG